MTTEKSNHDGQSEYQEGTTVIYGLMGRCSITSIETKTVGSEQIEFYKLEPQKSTFSRSKKQDPSIWLPISTARKRGLRLPMTDAQANQVREILGNREYYFPVDQRWSDVQPTLDRVLNQEGAIGLAKVLGYLHVVRNRQLVPTPELVKFYELVHRLLVREMADLTEQPIKAIETEVEKLLKQKLIPDN